MPHRPFKKKEADMSVRTALLIVSLAALVIITGYKFGKKILGADGDAAPATEQSPHGLPPMDAMEAPTFGQDRRFAPQGSLRLEPDRPFGSAPIEVVVPDDPPPPPPFMKGDVVIVTRIIHDATVRNPAPVGRKPKLAFGSTCDVDARGTLSVVGVDGDEALVRYRRLGQWIEPEQRPRRVVAAVSDRSCPSGTLFFIRGDVYLKRTQPARIAKVKDLLMQEKPRKVRIRSGRTRASTHK
jgi:uncharacterized Fe-S cluster protein YjdI